MAIYDVVLRYCRGIDRLDMGLVRSCYHPDGVDHHTGFVGTAGRLVAWVGDALRTLPSTMHVVGSRSVSIVGDVAIGRDVRYRLPSGRSGPGHRELHHRLPMGRPHGAPGRRVADQGAIRPPGVDPVRAGPATR